MASYGYTFTSGDTVTPTKLNNARTVSDIVNADIASAAAIDKTKISGTAITAADTGTVTSAMIADGAIVNADINASAAIAGSKLADAGITAAKLDGAQTGSAPIYGCRAWVNFNGNVANNLSGTYSQSGTTVTVTATAHGHIVGNRIYADITSGSGVDGFYTIVTVPDANTFTYTAGTSLTTSGNVTLLRRTIRGSGNVNSVAYTPSQAATYVINFSTNMPDNNYAACITSGTLVTSGQGANCLITDRQTGRVEMMIYNVSTGGIATDADVVCAMVLR